MEVESEFDTRNRNSLKKENDMGMMEKAYESSFYLKALTKIRPGIKLVGVGFFKGRLDFARLSFFDRLK